MTIKFSIKNVIKNFLRHPDIQGILFIAAFLSVVVGPTTLVFNLLFDPDPVPWVVVVLAFVPAVTGLGLILKEAVDDAIRVERRRISNRPGGGL